MVGDKAAGVGAAHPGTRVNAVLVDTGQVARAFRVAHALRLTLDIRVADVVTDALARGGPVALAALGVDAAGRGIAGLDDLNRAGSCCRRVAH